MKRFAVLGMSTALLLGGGSGLLAAALSGGPAGADTTLGGFTINALAEGITAQYEQPNLPIPATPSLEFDEGYAITQDNFGPSGSATASTFFPGQVVANLGPNLALLVPGVPLPPAPAWPLVAVTDYPQTPNTQSLDEPGVNMDAVSNTDGDTATSTVGDDAADAGAQGIPTSEAPSAAGNPLASISTLIGIGTVSGTSNSSTSTTAATASASATDTGISILGGFINIGGVTSTATATSDGTKATVTGSTSLANVTIAGEAVTVSGQGFAAAGKSNPLALPISALNTILGELGISFAVTNAKDVISGASASRTLDGFTISINLDTLDNAANKFATLLPKSIISSLPIAIPNEQVLTLELGTVSVSSAASPPFTDDGSGDTASADTSGDLGSPTTAGDTSGGSFDSGTGSSLGGTGTTPSTGSGAGSPSDTSGSGSGSPTAALAPVFGGIGSGLVLLGLLASGIMAYAWKRTDDASEMLGAACADGDPLNERFSGESDYVDDLEAPT